MKNSFAADIGLEDKPWVKCPLGLLPALSNLGYTSGEILVCMYVFFTMGLNNLYDDDIVVLTCQDAVAFSNVTKGVFYSAMLKMAEMGLAKVGVRKYDTSRFMSYLKNAVKGQE